MLLLLDRGKRGRFFQQCCILLVIGLEPASGWWWDCDNYVFGDLWCRDGSVFCPLPSGQVVTYRIRCRTLFTLFNCGLPGAPIIGVWNLHCKAWENCAWGFNGFGLDRPWNGKCDVCIYGYSKPGGSYCTSDLDECLVDNGGCYGHSSCNNTVGSYKCVCDDGYTKNPDGFSCSVNINVTSLTAPLNHIAQGDAVMLLMNVTQGDMTRFNFSFGDGETLEIDVDPTDALVGEVYEIWHVYTVLGTYRPDVVWQHKFNPGWNGSMIMQGDPIVVGQAPNGLTVTASSTLITEYQTVTFTVGASEGTFITYYLDYGDGSFAVKVVPIEMSYTMTMSFQHEYRRSGKYMVTVVASNRYGSKARSFEGLVNVVKAMEPVTWESDEPVSVPNGSIKYTVQVLDGQDPGSSNPVLDFTYGDGTGDTFPADNLTKLIPFDQEHTFSRSKVGGVPSGVSARGTFGVHNLNMIIDIEETITGLSLSAIPPVYNLESGSGQLVLNVSVVTGSHVNFMLDYNDGNNETFEHSMMFASEYDLFFTHSFEEPGVYVPQLHAENQISEQNVTLPEAVQVDNRVRTLFITAPSSVQYPPGLTELGIIPPYGYAAPTSVSCAWYVNGSLMYTSDASILGNMQIHFQTLQLSLHHVGFINVWINCSNPISFAIVESRIAVVEDVSGATIRTLERNASVGQEVHIEISLRHGSHVSASVDFRDGNSTSLKFPQIKASEEPLVLSYKYETAHNYTIKATLCNEYSCVECTTNEPIVVQKAVKGLIFEQSQAADVDAGVVTFLVKQEIGYLPPSNVFLRWHYPDGNTELTYASELSVGSPFLKSYSFSEEFFGSHPVTLDAYNLVSKEILATNFSMQESLRGVRCIADRYALAVGDYVLTNIFIDNGSHVNLEINFGDGSILDVSYDVLKGYIDPHNIDYNLKNFTIVLPGEISVTADIDSTTFGTSYNEWTGQIKHATIKHEYTTPGEYVVALTAFNDLRRVTTPASGPLHVEEKIDGNLQITLVNAIVQPPGEVEVTIGVTVVPVPTGVTCKLNFTHSSLSFISQINVIAALNQAQIVLIRLPTDMLGMVQVSTTCSNHISELGLHDVVSVQEELSAVVVAPEANDVGVGKDVVFFLTMETGSDVSVEMSYGDGYNDTTFVPGRVRTHSIHHIFDSPGSFAITVSCKNALSTRFVSEVTINVHVVLNETDLTLGGDLDIAVPFGREGTGTVHVAHENKIITGPGIQTIWQTEFSKESFTDITVQGAENTFHCDAGGYYEVLVRVKNLISEGIVNGSVQCIEEIHNVLLEVTSRGYSPLYSHETNMATVPSGIPVTFSVKPSWGSHLNYILTDGTRQVLSQTALNKFTYTFEDDGILTVNVSNIISQWQSQIVVKVEKVVNIETVGPVHFVVPNKGATFVVNLVHNATLPCYKFSPGDETSFFYGVGCPVGTPQPVAVSDNGLTLSFNHTYKTTGRYSFLVDGWNVVSRATKTIELSVNTEPCSPTNVTIQGTGRTVQEPRIEYKSNPIRITTFTTVSCEITNHVDFLWWQQVEDRLKKLTFSETAEITFPELYFDPGLHNIVVYASIANVFGTQSQDSIVLEIIESPLVVAILGGSARNVGWNTTFTLDAFSMTYDPNVQGNESTENITFTWYCQYTDASKEVVGTVLSSGLDRLITEDESRCFTGALSLKNTQSGVISMNTMHLKLDTEYSFKVETSKGKKKGVYTQDVMVVTGNPPMVQTSCLRNCLRKLNPEWALVMKATCLDCLDTEPDVTYAWVIYLYDWQRSEYYPLEGVLQDSESQTLFIPAGMLVGGQKYRLRGYIGKNLAERGYSDYELITNLPPYGGDCSASPESGDAMSTMFRITCSGWKDEGDNVRREDTDSMTRVQLYYILAQPVADNPDDVTILRKSATASFGPMALPAGNASDELKLQLVVVVRDQFGSRGRSHIAVKVREPTSGLTLLTDVTAARPDATVSKLDQVLGAKNIDFASPTLFTLMHEANRMSVEILNENRLTEEDKKRKFDVLSPIYDTIASGMAKSAESVTSFEDSYQVVSLLKMGQTKQPSFDYQKSVLLTAETIIEKMESFGDGTYENTMSLSQALLSLLADLMNGVTKNANSAQNKVYSDQAIAEAIQATIDNASAIVSPKQLEKILSEEQAIALKERGQQWEKAQTLIPLTNQLLDVLSEHIGKTMLESDGPLILKTDEVQLAVQLVSIEDVPGTALSLEGIGDIEIEDDVTVDSRNGEPITLVALGFSKNPYVWTETASFVTTPVIKLSIRGGKSENVTLSTSENTTATRVNLPLKFPTSTKKTIQPTANSMSYHAINLTQNGSSMLIHVEPLNDSLEYKIFLMHQMLPSINNFDKMGTPRQDQNGYKLVFQNASFVEGSYFLGVTQHAVLDSGLQLVVPQQQYSLCVYEIDCRVFHEDNERWTQGDCKVDSQALLPPPIETRHQRRRPTGRPASEQSLKVRTNYPVVGGGLIFPPNLIDFRAVFSNLGERFLDSPVVLAVVLGIVLLYIPILLWARRQDKNDFVRWQTFETSGNSLVDQFAYKIDIHTGLQPGSGTTCNVFINITGEDGKSDVRKLQSRQHKGFQAGTVHSYLLTSYKDLGALQYLHIWHDNSGRGRNKSWYLNKISVEDLRNKRIYDFICEDWLSDSDGDCKVERVLTVAAESLIKDFHYLFFGWWRGSLFDSHAWLSVWYRPRRSNFTRAQRLTVIITALYLTMIANAMWYREDGEEASPTIEITLGPFVINYEQLYASVMSCSLVFPFIFLLKHLFVYTDPTTRTLKEAIQDWKNYKRRNMVNHSTQVEGGMSFNMTNHDDCEYVWLKTKHKKLPYVCIYFGWTFCAVICVTSAFFTVMYSLSWGGSKANRWLTAIFLSVTEDVFVVSVGHIALFSVIFAFLAKNPDEVLREDDSRLQWSTRGCKKEVFHQAIMHEIMQDLTSVQDVLDEESLSEDGFASQYATNEHVPGVTDSNKILKEKDRLSKFISSFAIRLIYVVALLVASNSHVKEHTNYSYNSGVRDVFTLGEDNYITKEGGPKLFWEWAEDVVIPGAYAGEWYNGKLASWRERRFLSDRQSFRLGPPRLRQLRIKPGNCNLIKIMRSTMVECNPKYSSGNEDTRNYYAGWRTYSTNASTEPLEIGSAFQHHSASELNGFAVSGHFTFYPGSGYVADLAEEKEDAIEILNKLKNAEWVTLYTRAVIVEFTMYNANENIFSHVMLLYETPATGGGLTTCLVDTFRVYGDVDSTLTAITELICLVLYLGFCVGAVGRVIKQKKQFFRQLGHWVELVHLLLGLTVIVLFIIRLVLTTRALGKVLKAKGEFANFQLLSEISQTFVAVLGLIIFVNLIMLLRVLQTSYRFRALNNVLIRSRFDFFAFLIYIGILHMGFASFFYVYLGMFRFEYSTFVEATGSLTAMLLGGGENFKAGVAAGEDLLARVMIVFYGGVVTILLVNFFIAMLVSVIDQVSVEMRQLSQGPERAEVDILDQLASKLSRTAKDAVQSLKTIKAAVVYTNRNQ